MELLNIVLARSLVIKYNLCTSNKEDLYINAYNAYLPVFWSWHITYRPVYWYLIEPKEYVIISDHTS
jgi:hypothetical protein